MSIDDIDGWVDRAACRGSDPDMFFPERGVSTSEAKAVCARCEVRDECLDYALANGEKAGIWGGKSERERRRMRRDLKLERKPQPINHGTPGGYRVELMRGLTPCHACREAMTASRRASA